MSTKRLQFYLPATLNSLRGTGSVAVVLNIHKQHWNKVKSKILKHQILNVGGVTLSFYDTPMETNVFVEDCKIVESESFELIKK